MPEFPSTSQLASLSRLTLVPGSLIVADGVEYALVHSDRGQRLAALAAPGSAELAALEGACEEHSGRTLVLGPRSPRNAAALRQHLPWLRPQLLGTRTSIGLGDRLGLATAGHARAMRATGGQIAPLFAQQSIREMTLTGRSPQQVMDDVTWGLLAAGWREQHGADADHLKTLEDIDRCVEAGFTFFTIDAGEYVDDDAARGHGTSLREAFDALPWPSLEDMPAAVLHRYAGRTFELEGHRLQFEADVLVRAAVKYGKAISHVARMYRHLLAVADNRPFEIEVSLDDTAYPTSHLEHLYIASELRRIGVRWVSLAPRFIGRFEKGVDYIGDPAALEADLAVHAAIARQCGPYKISLHSGSDKFRIYEMAARQCQGLVHLKTAGTSYLEALRTLAALDPSLFREVYAYARQRYAEDRDSYRVSAQLERAPAPQDLADQELPQLLAHFDARQILHVTFGSVLSAGDESGRRHFYDRLLAVLSARPEPYLANLELHFLRHLRPFVAWARTDC